jgi:hypothetical protein
VDRAAKAARIFHVAATQLEELRSDTKPDANIDTASLDEMLGMLGGVTVLEALGLELVLKARLLQSGITPPKWHSHSDLFALLPEANSKSRDRFIKPIVIQRCGRLWPRSSISAPTPMRDGAITTSSQRRGAWGKRSGHLTRWWPLSRCSYRFSALHQRTCGFARICQVESLLSRRTHGGGDPNPQLP